MTRKIPPFASMRAFEAAARLGNVKEASEELCLSASAISHQIRVLEEYLGSPVFRRTGNRLELTLTGRAYARSLTRLLNAFEEWTNSAKRAGGRTFRVYCPPEFASRWLLPRLDRLSFGGRVQICVATKTPGTDLSARSHDVVIAVGETSRAGTIVEPFLRTTRYPVCSPFFVQRTGLTEPIDLCRITLLHNEKMDGWAQWFDIAGIEPPILPCGPIFPNDELALVAAELGQGVALAFESFVRPSLHSGALVRLFDQVKLPTVKYSVSYPAGQKDDPMLREFSDWIHGEAGNL